MATYTVTVKNKNNAQYGNCVDYIKSSSYVAIPNGDTVLESGTLISVETLGDIYVDGVQQSDVWWEGYLNSDMLVEFDGEDAYVTTNYSGSSGGSHKTLVSGTAYEITGGKVLVSGTAYDISIGKTMVDGTVYDIEFPSSGITVNITGTGSSSYCYVEIGGNKYYKATTLEVEPGTEFEFMANGTTTTNRAKCSISLNGSVVAQGQRQAAANYVFTPDASVVNISLSYGSYGTITITTS